MAAGAVAMLAYVVGDRVRRGSFFKREPRETERLRQTLMSMTPLFAGIGALLYVLSRFFPDDLRRLGIGVLIGLIGAGVPFVVANYIRLHAMNERE